ncbi:hypothetical protein [Defluviimonas sp. WL0075]|uniref:Uncharacterized protein n=1 Tax=Albidovulum sediminicola TaxID=2984331 RepID=A0ABT2YWT3_9RHOB|nr:hypothetical protein [Defluviimonas sp. WL0075]MCV2863336.1 hypothetical protein [Defluviimonas sp. WL0075]
MTATTITPPSPVTATCATCAKTFIPPAMASERGGNATTCRACAADRIEARRRAEADAYTAVNTSGISHA